MHALTPKVQKSPESGVIRVVFCYEIRKPGKIGKKMRKIRNAIFCDSRFGFLRFFAHRCDKSHVVTCTHVPRYPDPRSVT